MYQTVMDEGWLALIALTGILSLVAVSLLIHLFGFHIYLICKGLTTYDYIVMHREDLKPVEEDRRYSSSKNSTVPKSSKKGNRVTPTKAKAGSDQKLHGASARRKLTDTDYFEYNREARERQEEGETPPPTSSPLRTQEDDDNNHLSRHPDVNATPVKRLKKKTKKQKAEQHVTTVDNPKLYSQLNQSRHSDYHSDSADSMTEVSIRKPPDVQSYDSAMITGDASRYSSQASLVSSGSIKKTAKKKKSRPVMHPEQEEDDLNATTMFSVNDRAKFQKDGSLDYSNGFNSLPLTPILLRKRQEVPPLDFSLLRSSTESSNTFRPYSAPLRASDTFRMTDRPLPSLKSVPEGGIDTEV